MKPGIALPKEIGRVRELQHLTQKELGSRVGCSQAAISLLELGDAGAVGRPKLAKICEVLGIDVSEFQSVESISEAGQLLFCSRATCPRNIPFLSNGKLCFKPVMLRGDSEELTFCPDCGSMLSQTCHHPGCETIPQSGDAFCVKCGTSLVEIPRELARRKDLKQLVIDLIEQRRMLADCSAEFRVAGHTQKRAQAQKDERR